MRRRPDAGVAQSGRREGFQGHPCRTASRVRGGFAEGFGSLAGAQDLAIAEKGRAAHAD